MTLEMKIKKLYWQEKKSIGEIVDMVKEKYGQDGLEILKDMIKYQKFSLTEDNLEWVFEGII